MSAIYEVSSQSSVGAPAPPPYAVSYESSPTEKQEFSPSDKSHLTADIASPTILVARYSQTLNTLPADCDLPEVVVPSQHTQHAPASEGLIPVETTSVTSPVPETVTPLHLLGDQSDTVDCPFCCRRVETRIKKDPSYVTHITATTLFITTFAGAVAPYKKHWTSNITHYCTNCDRKVAHRAYGKKMVALGTPEHLKVVSKFPAAASKETLP